MLKRVLFVVFISVFTLSLISCRSNSENQANLVEPDGATSYNVLCEAILDFEYVWEFSDGYAAVYKDGKWGYIDKAGQLAVPVVFYYAEPFVNGLAVVSLAIDSITDDWTALYILISKDGLPFAMDEYQFISEFKDGLAIVAKQSKFGYIDINGQEAVPCEYDMAFDFSEGLAAVSKDNVYGFIDKAGKTIIPLQYESAYSFSEGLAWVSNNGKYGFIDTTGKVAIPLEYSYVSSFCEGLAIAESGEYPDIKMGYIDTTGKVAIPFDYVMANDFSDGAALVMKEGDYDFCYIDKTGQVIAHYDDYESILSFSEGLAPVRLDDQWGFIDATGKVTIACEYEWVDENGFKDGLAMVKKEDKWGFIDKGGHTVIPFDYEALYAFTDGFAAAINSGKFGIIDKAGNVIVPFEYDFIGYINEGLALIKEGDKWGVLELLR